MVRREDRTHMTQGTAFLETLERETGPGPRFTIVWLHGLGADGHDFAPVVPELVRPGWPALRFVFPHAPVRAVTINNHARMRAWYDIVDFDLATRADEAGVAQSVAAVEALVAREADRGVPRERVLLAGFSQGGAVALAAALQSPAPLAGVVALSTYLPAPGSAAARFVPGAEAAPVFMAHGTQDPVVPVTAGRQAAERLRAFGFRVDWHDYPMPHSVCAEEVRDLGDWLDRRFAG
jgi:phospholipase/carboxylesterase